MAKVTVLLEKWMVAETESREQVQGDVTIESWTELSPEVTLMCLSSSLVKDQPQDVSLPYWLFEHYILHVANEKYFSLSSYYIDFLL